MVVQEVKKSTYRMEVQIPQPSLKYLNAYVLKSSDNRIGLIDTGWDSEMSFSSFLDNLNTLGITIKDIKYIVITHFHVDHLGLVTRIKARNKDVKIYMSKIDKHFISTLVSYPETYVSSTINMLKSMGAPKEMYENIGVFPWAKRVNMYAELISYAEELSDNETLKWSDRELGVIWTPGHTPGHICLYDFGDRILFSGDHILPTISSNISQLTEEGNYLLDYLRSLNKVLNMEVKEILPAHQYIFTNLEERIKELKEHHLERLIEAANSISLNGSTPYEIASKIKWKLGGKRWEEADMFQKNMALGETFAHLVFLERLGMVVRKVDPENGIIKYFKTDKVDVERLKEEFSKLLLD